MSTLTLNANRGIYFGSSGNNYLVPVAGVTLTYDGIAAGTGDLNVISTGSGIVVLGGNNTYSGSTTVSTGTLEDGVANALPNTTALTVQGTGTFDLAGFAQTVGGLADGSVTTGTVTDSGAAATFTVNDASASNFSGLITDGSGALSLVKNGAGTLTLSHANSYTGSTTIDSGILSISADLNLGAAPGSATVADLVLNGGTLATTANLILSADRGISLGIRWHDRRGRRHDPDLRRDRRRLRDAQQDRRRHPGLRRRQHVQRSHDR